jgi:hypothetical protein
MAIDTSDVEGKTASFGSEEEQRKRWEVLMGLLSDLCVAPIESEEELCERLREGICVSAAGVETRHGIEELARSAWEKVEDTASIPFARRRAKVSAVLTLMLHGEERFVFITGALFACLAYLRKGRVSFEEFLLETVGFWEAHPYPELGGRIY